jgi:hypothetical protein
MIKKKLIWIVVIIVTVSIVIFCLYCLWIWRAVVDLSSITADANKKRVQLLYETDHEALLQGCRSLMEQKRDNSLNMNYWFFDSPSDGGLRINGNFREADLPEVIVNLNPTFIVIFEDDRVLIELVASFHSVLVQAYPVGVEGDGDTKLLNGLWYWDIGYEKMKNFDKYLEDLKSKYVDMAD